MEGENNGGSDSLPPLLGIEPNISELLKDGDEGSNLWRRRARNYQKRAFVRRQLLVTVS